MTALGVAVISPLALASPEQLQARSSVGEHLLDVEGVGGSIPPVPTKPGARQAPRGVAGVLVLTERIMPKMKTNRSAAKRFSRTGTGKLKHKKAFKNHILTKKSAKRIRQLRSDGLLQKGDEARMKAILPYL